MLIRGIYGITAGWGGSVPGLVDQMEAAWRGGAAAMQIREKAATDQWLLALGHELLRRGHGRPVQGSASQSMGASSPEVQTSPSPPQPAIESISSIASPQSPQSTPSPPPRRLLLLNGDCVEAWPWHLVLPDGLHLSAGNADRARRHLAEAAGCGALRLPYVWSAHSPEEARAALDGGASAVTISPVYATASHPGQPPGGVDLLRAAVEACGPGRVIALGGVGPGRVAECRRAGAAAVAMIGSIFSQPDVELAVKSLADEWGAP